MKEGRSEKVFPRVIEKAKQLVFHRIFAPVIHNSLSYMKIKFSTF